MAVLWALGPTNVYHFLVYMQTAHNTPVCIYTTVGAPRQESVGTFARHLRTLKWGPVVLGLIGNISWDFLFILILCHFSDFVFDWRWECLI